MSLASVIHKLRERENLSQEETKQVFDDIFSGELPEDHIAAFLLALHRKGETTDEILGAVASMRAKALTISAPQEAIDIVGTGGDAKGTLNISTAAALVIAACGVPVAKHGNKAATSLSGSSDVLASLGINLEPSFDVLEKCLSKTNLCFLFAPRHHPSMRHVAAVRKKLGVRTIFNLLGPLTNPANVTRHVIGVYSADWLTPMAKVLQALGSSSAWMAHGQDGMDELTITTKSDVVLLQNGKITSSVVSPLDAGLELCAPETLKGKDAATNAEAIKRLLKGEKSPYRDIVLLNAAAALIVAGRAPDLRKGVALAAENLDNGAAEAVLRNLIEITNTYPL